MKVWNLKTRGVIRTPPTRIPTSVYSVRVPPQKELTVAAAGCGSAESRVWDLTTGHEVFQALPDYCRHPLYGTAYISSVAFSPRLAGLAGGAGNEGVVNLSETLE